MSVALQNPTHSRLAAALAGAGRLAGGLLAVLRVVLGLVLLLMVVVNVANAAGRYGFGISFTGADELVVYAVVWLVMTGMVVVTAEGRHLSLDAVQGCLHRRGRLNLALFHNLLVAACCGYAAVQSFAFVSRVARVGQVSMGLGIPTVIPHSALLVGFSLTALTAACLALGTLAALVREGDGA
ncbi:TRAP transporter small permease [Azospirillum sp. ST 5-10]|uniref:TRAP transporter small permease n=1 Tax=unclassified Azospirillum TaxID=2630922 RepID=UPI003F4A4703